MEFIHHEGSTSTYKAYNVYWKIKIPEIKKITKKRQLKHNKQQTNITSALLY